MMRTKAVMPFLTVSAKSLELSPWHYINQRGDPVLVNDGIAGWDYSFDLEFSRKAIVDMDAVRKGCFLSPDNALFLAIIASAPYSRFRSCVYRTELPGNGMFNSTISALVPAEYLADRLMLSSEIVLGARNPSASAFAPLLAGSRLFEETVNVQLEGKAGRFPTEILDFSEQLKEFRSPDAYWCLYWESGDLDVPVQRAVRLYLNSRHEALVDKLAGGDSLEVKTLQADVARQLIAETISNDEFTGNPIDYPDGSLGQTSANLVQICFSGMSIENVRALLRDRASKFETMIQSGLA